ncbi:MAG: nodulation protein NfeD [candidate division Zixibacteria bacterium]|nr:nodulation protein NfeD [candidate division Zixibacteria bacterium]
MKRIVILTGCCLFLLLPVISYILRTVDKDSPYQMVVLAALVPDSVKPASPATRPIIYTITIDGAIGAVTDDRLADALDQAENAGAELLVVILDTPGGFTRPTWSICKRFLNSLTPVCVYIAPSGARAGSAGVYMTYAAHIAAMAPSTNIGAAHPVGGEGEKIDSIMNEKITNDAVAQIKAAADKRGRNAGWAERAVRQSVSITDREALDSNVINLRAENLDSLLAKLNGREVELPTGKKTLHLVDPDIRPISQSFVQRFLGMITQPDVAFILFSLGGLGIVLELYNPGAILPGVVGGICLILAFYSFQTLPINWAGVALIVLAIILFIAEIKVISHGLLTIGGIVSLFLGGLMLIDTVDPTLRVSTSVLITVAVAIGALAFTLVFLVVKASRNKPFLGKNAMVGRTAEVRADGYVYLDGALWKVTCDESLAEGTKIEVVDVDQLTLKVKRIG